MEYARNRNVGITPALGSHVQKKISVKDHDQNQPWLDMHNNCGLITFRRQQAHLSSSIATSTPNFREKKKSTYWSAQLRSSDWSARTVEFYPTSKVKVTNSHWGHLKWGRGEKRKENKPDTSWTELRRVTNKRISKHEAPYLEIHTVCFQVLDLDEQYLRHARKKESSLRKLHQI